MGHFNHEDELYNVAMAKFYSSHRPVGLRPAGRFLSLCEELWDKTASCVGCSVQPVTINIQKNIKYVNENSRHPNQKK